MSCWENSHYGYKYVLVAASEYMYTTVVLQRVVVCRAVSSLPPSTRATAHTCMPTRDSVPGCCFVFMNATHNLKIILPVNSHIFTPLIFVNDTPTWFVLLM